MRSVERDYQVDQGSYQCRAPGRPSALAGIGDSRQIIAVKEQRRDNP